LTFSCQLQAERAAAVASVEAMDSIDAFIDQLPKVELHLHLVGSASVPTVLELARRHPERSEAPHGQVPRTEAELAAFFEFRDFPHFAEVYGAVSALVREPADVAARRAFPRKRLVKIRTRRGKVDAAGAFPRKRA